MQSVLENYLTREQLADELKITPRTLDKWAWLGEGPKKAKIGGRCWYDRDDVAAWLKAKAGHGGTSA